MARTQLTKGDSPSNTAFALTMHKRDFVPKVGGSLVVEAALVGGKTMGMMAAVLFSLGVWAATTQWHRAVDVYGSIVAAGGLATITAARDGIIGGMKLKEQDVVHNGQALMTLSTDYATGASAAIGREQLATGERRMRAIRQEANQLQARMDVATLQLRMTIDGGRTRVAELQYRMGLQTERLVAAKGVVAKLEPLAAEGTISKLELAGRTDRVLELVRELSELREALAAARTQHSLALREQEKQQAEFQREKASLEGAEAALAQEHARLSAEVTIVAKAPFAGRIATIFVHDGEVVAKGDPLVTLVAPNPGFVAELRVPALVASRMHIGDQVRLMISGVLGAQYEQIAGRVEAVSSAPFWRGQSGGETATQEPVYLLRVRLKSAPRYGGETPAPFLPGMRVNARVLYDSPTLLRMITQAFQR